MLCDTTSARDRDLDLDLDSRSSLVFTVPGQFVPRGTDPKGLETRVQQVCGHEWKRKTTMYSRLFLFFLQSLVKIGLNSVGFFNVAKCS